MSSELRLRGARIVDPATGMDGPGELLLKDGVVAQVGPEVSSAARTLDLDGLVVAPGFIDIHVHLREPGQEYKETIATGSASAVAGGFSAVVTMANTDPVNDCREVTELIVAEALRSARARIYPVGSVSKGLEGKQLSEMGELAAAGVVAFSDDGRPIMDASLMRRALEYSQIFDLPVLVHEQDEALVGEGVVHEGLVSTRLGLPAWPAVAEDSMIARDLLLANDFGGQLHVQHLTTARGLELVGAAKARGLPVTCEVTPHHLLLTDDAVSGFDTDLKMNPPLRSIEDRDGLVAGLAAAGLIDAIATDHAPHHGDEKDDHFCCAPFGTIGLESAVSSCLGKLVHENGLPLARLIELFTVGPARALDLPGGSLAEGAIADVTVLDLERSARIDPDRFASKGRNCAFTNWELTGAPVMTIVGGEIVHDAR